MPKILIPTPLRQFTAKENSVTVPGATVGEALDALAARYPDLRQQLFTPEGKVRSFVNVYLNDEDIRYLGKTATPTAEADTISLVPSIAGGASVAAPPEAPHFRTKRSCATAATSSFPKSAWRASRN